MSQMLRVAWIAIRELIYERVFYVLLCFAAFSLGLSFLLGQMTYADQAKLTLDFMLGGTQLCMVLFAVFMGIGLLKKELTWGSVSMVLSKPVSRWAFLLGKFLGQITVQGAVILAMVFFTLLFTTARGYGSFVSVMQAGLLIFFEVTLLTAITYFFAVNAGAITTALGTLSIFCLGHIRGPITQNVEYRGETNVFWHVTQGLLPDLEIFNMKMLASYGHTISSVELWWATAYFLCCVSIFLALAIGCFSRKDVLT